MEHAFADGIEETAPGQFEAKVLVSNDLGLHARPAALVAQTAQQYTAETHILLDERQVDAKSILDILSLAATKGSSLTIRGLGQDAENCVKAIAELIRTQFGEAGE